MRTADSAQGNGPRVRAVLMMMEKSVSFNMKVELKVFTFALLGFFFFFPSDDTHSNSS